MALFSRFTAVDRRQKTSGPATASGSTWSKLCCTHRELICFMALMVFVSLMLRTLSLGLYPLMDTTEARYGEMARIMFETGNWVTPMFDYDVPFWGKPPLFSWLSATGFQLFGVNEFAARIPHLLVGMLTIGLTGWFARRQNQLIRQDQAIYRLEGIEQGWLVAMILTTTCAWLLMSAAVMTDTALTFAISLSMISFWQAWHTEQKRWGYLFFTGLAIGMLAKGPLTLVLVGISLTLWLAVNRRWCHLFQRLPWFGGTLLFLLLTLPWYIAAELRSPGFLNYFIIGEHFKRFVISGWQGDLYGSAHNEIRGTIWIYWLVASLPWGPVLIWQLFRFLSRRPVTNVGETRGYSGFLWCWMLSPMILFTFAGNILPSYVLPGIPAMALLVAEYYRRQPFRKGVMALSFLAPVMVLGVVWGLNSGVSSKEAEKGLLQQWRQQPEKDDSTLIYLRKRPFSAQFYSEGLAIEKDLPLSQVLSEASGPVFIVLEKERLSESAPVLSEYCTQRGLARKRVLYYCLP